MRSEGCEGIKLAGGGEVTGLEEGSRFRAELQGGEL